MRLSIIIPVFNEVGSIADLLSILAGQEGTRFEVIICDGGSNDGTIGKIRELSRVLPYPLELIQAEKGRGRQMNAAARVARGTHLLFLHADSSFPERRAISDGLSALEDAVAREGHDMVAGHFSLRFRSRDTVRSFSYYYGECKARLDRRGCTHGDQGFLVTRRFFFKSGGFDESCLVLEDTRFAELVRHTGRWILLPAEIWTSVRRFEAEGVAARQFLNAVIMTLDAVGREDLIRGLPGIYETQSGTGRLRITPFVDGILERLSVSPWRERMRFWQEAGRYLGENAWQIAFAADMHRNFRDGVAPHKGDTPLLRCFDRYLARFARAWPVAAIAGGLLRSLIRCSRLFDRRAALS